MMKSLSTLNRWVICPKPNLQAKLRTEYGVRFINKKFLHSEFFGKPGAPAPSKSLRFTAAAFVDGGGYFWVAIANFAPLT